MNQVINYVIILAITDIGCESVHLFINGEYQASYLPQHDGSDTDEFENRAEELAEMYNTDAQVFQITSTQLAESLATPGDFSSIDFDSLAQRGVIDVKDIIRHKTSFIDYICEGLIDGAKSDIWFAANEYGDTKRALQIDRAQNAMVSAAELLKAQNPIVLEKPLTQDEAEARCDANGYLTAVVAIDLSELIALGGIEEMNDFMDGDMSGGNKIVDAGYLSDISYTVVGHKKSENKLHGGSVLVEVTARVEF